MDASPLSNFFYAGPQGKLSAPVSWSSHSFPCLKKKYFNHHNIAAHVVPSIIYQVSPSIQIVSILQNLDELSNPALQYWLLFKVL